MLNIIEKGVVMAELEIKSTFAIVDVTTGREALAMHFRERPRLGKCPPKYRIPITLTGYLESVWGNDDGTSREFSMTVERVAIKQPKRPA